MVYDLENPPAGATGPAARLGDLIISECLGGGYPSLRLFGCDSIQGMEAIAVQYLVEGSWKEVMKIPAAAGTPVVAHFKSMCEVDPVHHPRREGAFKVKARGTEASIVARFTPTGGGVEEVEMQITTPVAGTN